MLNYDKRLTQLRISRIKKEITDKKYINKGSYLLLFILIVLAFLFF